MHYLGAIHYVHHERMKKRSLGAIKPALQRLQALVWSLHRLNVRLVISGGAGLGFRQGNATRYADTGRGY